MNPQLSTMKSGSVSMMMLGVFQWDEFPGPFNILMTGNSNITLLYDNLHPFIDAVNIVHIAISF